MHKLNYGLFLTLFVACNAHCMMQEVAGSPANGGMSINGTAGGNYQPIAQLRQQLTLDKKIEYQEASILQAFQEKGRYDTNSKLLLVASGVAAANFAKDLVESCATKDPYSLYTFCSAMANLAVSGTTLGFALHNHGKKIEQIHTIDSLLECLDNLTQEASRPEAYVQKHAALCKQFDLLGSRLSGMKGLGGLVTIATVNSIKDIGFAVLAPTQSLITKESVCSIVNDGVAYCAIIYGAVLIYRTNKQLKELKEVARREEEV